MLTARPRPRLLAAGAAAVLLLAIGAPVTANAAARRGPGADCPPSQADCSVWNNDPGQPGDPGDGGDDDSGGGSGGDRTCARDGKPVDCYDDILGWFNNSDGCYYKLQPDQPPETPEGKQAYVRSCGPAVETVYLDAPPDGFEAPPDPEELARRALATITLRGPTVHLAPNRGAGLVGLPVWMWTDELDAVEASASAPGLTVSIRAEVQKVLWNMGDGSEPIPCATAGTPYDPKVHKGGRSPDCGYHRGYQRASHSSKNPNGVYRVTATTTWRVTWEAGDDQNGELPPQVRDAAEPGTIRIDELQVVTS